MAQEQVQRRLAAIMAADVVGYSALMERAEEATYAQIGQLKREVIEPTLGRHQGRLIKTMGDGILAEFASPLAAVRCAIEIQDHLASGGGSLQLRIGLNLGDVIIDDQGDVYGDGINIAARLEGAADPGGILISGKVLSEVEGKLDLGFEDRGERQFKNISKQVRVYAVAPRAKPTSLPDIVQPPNSTEPPSLPDKPSIAVLPFQNMSGDPEQEYFADGLTEDIITELARASSMSVIARNSSFVHKGRAVDVKQVGRHLGARYVLEGSVRRANQRVRVTAQLIETVAGRHLWAEKYDRDLTDIFEIQDEITRSVVGSTETQVVLSEGSLAERNERPDFRSWDLAKRGLKKIYELTRESIEAAREIASELTRIDPSFAKGHQLFAAATYHLALMGFSSNPRETLEASLKSIQKSILLDDADERSHWILGGVLGQGLGYHDKAIAAYRRALELNPSFSLAFGSLGTVLALAGRAEESIRNSETCIRLNPRDPSIFFRFSGLALAYFVAQDYAKAREWSEKAVQRKRDWWQGHALLASSCALLGDHDEACAAVRDWLLALPSATVGSLPPLPFRSATCAERFRDSLRKAGLPE